MHLDNLLHTKVGKYILSFILGLGLASLFRIACKDKNCVIYKAPLDSENIENKTYKFADKCYKLTKEKTNCNANLKTINL
jgi:hypothetical protein